MLLRAVFPALASALRRLPPLTSHDSIFKQHGRAWAATHLFGPTANACVNNTSISQTLHSSSPQYYPSNPSQTKQIPIACPSTLSITTLPPLEEFIMLTRNS